MDVRGPNAFASGHVKGAINIPHRDMTATRMAQYPKDELFVVYCAGPHCNGANKAALRLRPARLTGKDDDRRRDWLDRRRFYIDAVVTLAVVAGVGLHGFSLPRSDTSAMGSIADLPGGCLKRRN